MLRGRRGKRTMWKEKIGKIKGSWKDAYLGRNLALGVMVSGTFAPEIAH